MLVETTLPKQTPEEEEPLFNKISFFKCLSFEERVKEFLKEKNEELFAKDKELIKLKALIREKGFPERKTYRIKEKEPITPLNNLVEAQFLAMLYSGRVDYFRIKMLLEDKLSSNEKSVLEFILQKTIKLKTGFGFISYKEFKEGFKVGNQICIKALNIDSKTLRSSINSLVARGLILKHKFKGNTSYLYLVNIPKSREIYDLILKQEIDSQDCEQINLVIRKNKLNFNDIKPLEYATPKEKKLNPKEALIKAFNVSQAKEKIERKEELVKVEQKSDFTTIVETLPKVEKVEVKATPKNDFTAIGKVLPKLDKKEEKFEQKVTTSGFTSIGEVLPKLDEKEDIKILPDELINKVINLEVNNEKVDFKKELLVSLAKKFPLINNVPITQVIENQIKWFPFRKNLANYNKAAILYKCIQENRECPKEYYEVEEQAKIEKESEFYIPVLKIWDDGYKYTSINRSNSILILSKLIMDEYRRLLNFNEVYSRENQRIKFAKKIYATLELISLEDCLYPFLLHNIEGILALCESRYEE